MCVLLLFFCFCVHYEHARYVMLCFDLYAFCISVVCYMVVYDIMISLSLHAVIRTHSVSAVSSKRVTLYLCFDFDYD